MYLSISLVVLFLTIEQLHLYNEVDKTIYDLKYYINIETFINNK